MITTCTREALIKQVKNVTFISSIVPGTFTSIFENFSEVKQFSQKLRMSPHLENHCLFH